MRPEYNNYYNDTIDDKLPPKKHKSQNTQPKTKSTNTNEQSKKQKALQTNEPNKRQKTTNTIEKSFSIIKDNQNIPNIVNLSDEDDFVLPKITVPKDIVYYINIFRIIQIMKL